MAKKEVKSSVGEGLERLKDELKICNELRKNDKKAQIRFFEIVSILKYKYNKGVTFYDEEETTYNIHSL